MTWTNLIPISSVRAKPNLLAVPLDLTNTADYLRSNVIDEPSVFEGGTNTFSIVGARKFVPFIDGIKVPATDYAYSDSAITFAYAVPANKQVLLMPTSLAFFFRDDGYIPQPVKYDIFGNKSKSLKNSIKSACPDYSPFQCTVRHEYAPDRVAKDVYGNEDLYWCIMEYNGLVFPEQILAGSVLNVPDKIQLRSWISSLTTKNVFTSNATKVRI